MVAAAAWGLIAAAPSVADSDVWKTAANGSWSAGGSWVDGSPPSSIFDRATFNLAGAYTVSFNVDPDPIGALTLTSSANVTFASSIRPPNPIPPRSLRLVDTIGASNGGLVVVGGATLTLGATTGEFPSTSHPFHLTADGSLRVDPTSTLNVKFGSSLTSSGSTLNGTVNVSAGSLFLSGLGVGSSGNGELNVTDGGVVHSSAGTVGDFDFGVGTVNVSGLNAQWINNGPLRIGNFGRGTLKISDGAAVQTTGSSPVVIGGERDGVGTAIVDGDNATWTVGGKLIVGDRGTGELKVTGGGRVTTINPILGASDGSMGTATVVGAGSTWTVQGFLGIGGDAQFRFPGGTGTLRIQPGGAVAGTLETVLFDGGQLSLEGGTLSTSNLAFTAGATADTNFSWTAGTLRVVNFFDDLVNEGGVLAPGITAGSTTIHGDYNQLSGATLQIEIGGIASGSQHDVVSVSSNAFLGGDLQLVLLKGFVPSAPNTFTVAEAMGNLFGSFVVNYGAGSAFNPNQVVLSSFQSGGLSGDFDSDGDVDGADFLRWQRGGSPTPNSSADLADWRANFGAQTSGVIGAAVPEPMTCWPVLAIACGELAFRRPFVAH